MQLFGPDSTAKVPARGFSARFGECGENSQTEGLGLRNLTPTVVFCSSLLAVERKPTDKQSWLFPLRLSETIGIMVHIQSRARYLQLLDALLAAHVLASHSFWNHASTRLQVI